MLFIYMISKKKWSHWKPTFQQNLVKSWVEQRCSRHFEKQRRETNILSLFKVTVTNMHKKWLNSNSINSLICQIYGLAQRIIFKKFQVFRNNPTDFAFKLNPNLIYLALPQNGFLRIFERFYFFLVMIILPRRAYVEKQMGRDTWWHLF